MIRSALYSSLVCMTRSAKEKLSGEINNTLLYETCASLGLVLVRYNVVYHL